jgi:hypothetical protein
LSSLGDSNSGTSLQSFVQTLADNLKGHPHMQTVGSLVSTTA